MKKILLDKNKNFYKANMHCHSTNSDGKFTPSQIKEMYKEKGYSIVAFTDHEHIIDNSYLNDDSFLAITSCEIAIKEFNELSTLVEPNMKVCHLNFYALDSSNTDTPCYNSVYDHFINDNIKDKIVHTCGEYDRKYSKEGICDIIKCANEKGFLVSYNHPRWSLENARDYLNYKGLWAVEIYNYGCYRRGLYEYNINAYDDFLRDSNKIACIAGDDNHNIGNDSFGGYVYVNCENLNYKDVMESLSNKNFYASTGPLITSLYIENNKAYLSFKDGEYAVMSTAGRRVKKIYADENNEKENAEFEFFDYDKYIRFDVVDKFGNRANTNAYFI